MMNNNTMSLIITEIINETTNEKLYRTESGTLYDKDFNIKFENSITQPSIIKQTNKEKEISETDKLKHTLSELIMSFNANEVFQAFMEELFAHVSKDFSGKEFTKEELVARYMDTVDSTPSKKGNKSNKKKNTPNKPKKVQPFSLFCKDEVHKERVREECNRRRASGEGNDKFLTVARVYFNSLSEEESLSFKKMAEGKNAENLELSKMNESSEQNTVSA
jgi:hypothetical protein